MQYITAELKVLTGRDALTAWVNDALRYEFGSIYHWDFGLDYGYIYGLGSWNLDLVAEHIRDLLRHHPDVEDIEISFDQSSENVLVVYILVDSEYGDIESIFDLGKWC